MGQSENTRMASRKERWDTHEAWAQRKQSFKT